MSEEIYKTEYRRNEYKYNRSAFVNVEKDDIGSVMGQCSLPEKSVDGNLTFHLTCKTSKVTRNEILFLRVCHHISTGHYHEYCLGGGKVGG